MSSTVELRTLKAQPVVSIRRKTSMDQLQAAFQEILPTVFNFLKSRGLTPAGPPFGRYHSFSLEKIDLEAGLPVAKAPALTDEDGPLQAGELPAGEAAVLMHLGPYDDLKRTYDALEGWLADHRREPSGGPWELYLTDPMAEPDPQKWQTEVIWPLR